MLLSVYFYFLAWFCFALTNLKMKIFSKRAHLYEMQRNNSTFYCFQLFCLREVLLVQSKMVLLSVMPLVTIASSNQSVTLPFLCHANIKIGMSQYCGISNFWPFSLPVFFNCFSQLDLLSLFHAPTPILVLSLL